MEDDRSQSPEAALAALFAPSWAKTVLFLALCFFGLALLRPALPLVAGAYLHVPGEGLGQGQGQGLLVLFWPYLLPFRVLELFVPSPGTGAVRAALAAGALLTFAYFYALVCLFVASDPRTVLAPREAGPTFVKQAIGDDPDPKPRRRTRRS